MRAIWAVLFLFIVTVECVAADNPPETYILKEAAPRVGTQIKAEMLRSRLPFDKTYEELSAQQLATLRDSYSHLAANDEPPYPEGGLARIGTEISRLPHNPAAHGPLVITVRVDDQGVAQSAAIYKSPDDDLASAIVAIVIKAKYKPAKCAGKPCPMEFPFIFDVGADR
jgi:hypothetical protein